MEKTTSKLIDNAYLTQLHKLVIKLGVSLESGDDFAWHPTTNSITYNPSHPNWRQLLIHELGHAELGHSDYQHDINLLKIERDAWHQADIIAKKLGITITEDVREDALDSYRDWLHARSICPQCNATGIETIARHYTCLACHHKWRVNEARSCGLRRYNIGKV